jgi:hypothetical protein
MSEWNDRIDRADALLAFKEALIEPDAPEGEGKQ